MKKNSIRIKRRQRRGSVSFNPDRQFVASAVEEFLNKGGKIEQLKPSDISFRQSMNVNDGSLDADEFLLGV